MPNIEKTAKLGHEQKFRELLAALYGDDVRTIQYQSARYQRLVEQFQQHFGEGDLHLFSSPGRTEIGGNHTDHNHGRVLAASVNLDAIAAAAKTNGNTITVYSDAYPAPFTVALNHLEFNPEEAGTTTALIRGIAARFKALGFQIGGFNACLTSEVMIGSGLSSSAAIEVLLGTILNHLYNDGRIAPETIALIGQYAENNYFNKPCGLMDQLTCAVGGIVTIDFEDPQKPVFKKVNFDFGAQNYSVLVVNTGGSHADLTEDYASVPKEMKSVAQALGKKVCREITMEELLRHVATLRPKVGDRAILRAFHFLADNQRVVEQVQALENGDFQEFLRLVNESGNSSNKWLQNSFTTKAPSEQGITLALALTEDYLKKIGAGACRVHGGGFAGTIQVFLPNEFLEEYVRRMESIFGAQAVSVLKIRPQGTVHVNSVVRRSY
ncbi:MAG: galactokinase [candidate division KSB1 bacterium]|nr:galactokinase [candidate division KSB1 bacterium]MDZ7302367.1 galactokinase [candidate division KSB1 bacterium]MDZ7313978.1 galactokinase [candidate division KSB1 bacterium]